MPKLIGIRVVWERNDGSSYYVPLARAGENVEIYPVDLPKIEKPIRNANQKAHIKLRPGIDTSEYLYGTKEVIRFALEELGVKVVAAELAWMKKQGKIVPVDTLNSRSGIQVYLKDDVKELFKNG